MICSAVYHFADSMSISMLQAFFAGMQEPFSFVNSVYRFSFGFRDSVPSILSHCFWAVSQISIHTPMGTLA